MSLRPHSSTLPMVAAMITPGRPGRDDDARLSAASVTIPLLPFVARHPGNPQIGLGSPHIPRSRRAIIREETTLL
jgi:hypothetical protein